jgi:hypothetical protein
MLKYMLRALVIITNLAVMFSYDSIIGDRASP